PSGHQQDNSDRNSIRRVGEAWHLRYQGEEGLYTAKCAGWLAKLLATPNHSLTVADLLGDPEGKLAADALLGTERETDDNGLRAIRTRLAEITDIAEAAGWSEHLETEHADLLARLKPAKDGKRLRSPVQKAHHSSATQIRTLLHGKLAADMPQLAAHL